MLTTAGSLSLLFMKGAMCLTAMPVAPMNTRASHSAKDLSVQSLTDPSILSTPRLSEEVLQNTRMSSSLRASLSLRAVLHPLVENAMAFILIRKPSGSPP